MSQIDLSLLLAFDDHDTGMNWQEHSFDESQDTDSQGDQEESFQDDQFEHFGEGDQNRTFREEETHWEGDQRRTLYSGRSIQKIILMTQKVTICTRSNFKMDLRPILRYKIKHIVKEIKLKGKISKIKLFGKKITGTYMTMIMFIMNVSNLLIKHHLHKKCPYCNYEQVFHSSR